VNDGHGGGKYGAAGLPGKYRRECR
jgi:hypothetical protein